MKHDEGYRVLGGGTALRFEDGTCLSIVSGSYLFRPPCFLPKRERRNKQTVNGGKRRLSKV